MIWRIAALVVAALSLGPSFAHVLEAPPRLVDWSPELWRETTVFNGQYRYFAILGAPLDLGAIIASALLALVLRSERPAFRWALAATIAFAVALTVWFGAVAPMNEILAGWTPGPIAADFTAVRNRWEVGHMIVATIKLAGFIAIAMAVVRARPMEVSRE